MLGVFLDDLSKAEVGIESMFDISVSMVQQLLHYASSQGINSGDLLNSVGIQPSILKDPDFRISVEDFCRIQEEAVFLTGDHYFGLHMGESSELGDWSMLGYIMANCGNLGEALERISRYFGILGSLLQINIRVGNDRVELIFETKKNSSGQIRQCLEGALSGFFRLIRSVTRKYVGLKEVWIVHEVSEDTGEYQRIFRCPVLFNQPMTALVFDSGALDAPMIHPNPALLSLFERHARSFLDRINEENFFSRKTSSLLFERLQGGAPCIKRVSEELGVSVRKLQMKLHDEGITFSQIVENVREELAKSYLAEKRYSIEDITHLLGFSEPSVFHRAFKKWTGLTPGQYRLSSKLSFMTHG